MSDKENKMERLKNRLIKLHAKINDRVEDFQDQMQTKIETKLSRLVSHLSDDKSSSGDKDSIERDEKSSTDDISSTESQKGRISVPSVIIDEPNLNVDPKQICKEFLTIEKNGVLYRRCLSTCNLAADDDCSFYSSSDSCNSGLSFSDERTPEIRPRAGSLPPEHNLEIPSAISTCSDFLERIGNRFRLMRKGDSVHRVFKYKEFWWRLHVHCLICGGSVNNT